MRVAIGLFLVCVALPGCFVIRFGDHDRTEYHEVPPRIPVSEWAEGSPRYSVVFEGSSTAFDDGDPKPDGEAAMFIVRQLRVARVFQSIYVPGSPRIPSDAARLRIEAHFRAVDHTAGNFAKALIPGALAHRYDLEGSMKLFLVLPSAEQPLVYEARTAASRFYYTAGHMAGAHQILLGQVGDSLVEGVIDQLRAEASLRLAPP